MHAFCFKTNFLFLGSCVGKVITLIIFYEERQKMIVFIKTSKWESFGKNLLGSLMLVVYKKTDYCYESSEKGRLKGNQN